LVNKSILSAKRLRRAARIICSNRQELIVSLTSGHSAGASLRDEEFLTFPRKVFSARDSASRPAPEASRKRGPR